MKRYVPPALVILTSKTTRRLLRVFLLFTFVF